MQSMVSHERVDARAQLPTFLRAHPHWKGVVRITAKRAKEALPKAGGRIEQAMALVRAGSVEIIDEHTTRVRSDGRTFDVNEECSCAEAKRSTEWCQHLIASWLFRRSLYLFELRTTLCQVRKSVH
jgi:hypothetical protein